MVNLDLIEGFTSSSREITADDLFSEQEIDVEEKTAGIFDLFKNFFENRKERWPLKSSQLNKNSASQKEEPTVGIVGNGEMFRKVRVTWINGIDHKVESNLRIAKEISEAYGNVNVHYVWNETAGFWTDLAQAGIQKMVGKITPEVETLASHFKRLIEELGGVDGGGKIIHLAHSQGALITYLAKSYLTKAERAMIDIKTFGPAQVITSQDYNSAVNYISTKDPLLYFSKEAVSVWHSGKPTNEIICMDPIGLDGYIDHSMHGLTYKSALSIAGKQFKDEYETYSAKAVRWAREKCEAYWEAYMGY